MKKNEPDIRIAQIAPLWKPIPPPKYGGVELVISNLTEELVKQGAKVTLFGCAGSKTAGEFVEVIDKPLYDLMGGFSWDSIPGYDFLVFDELFKRLNQFDIIHNHLGFQTLVFSELIDVPIVTTLHSSVGPDFPYLTDRFKDRDFISISNAQRTLVPELNYLATIYHGIKTGSFKPNLATGQDYFCFLGTLSKNKGIDLAVKAAHELGERLIIAGEIRKSDQGFLEKEVFPFVDGKKIKFIGEVNHLQKAKLLAGAKALLFPIRWNEAFGLVMAEAFACGTPVVAFNQGSVKEVIKEGVSGFIVDNFADFKDKMEKINEIDRNRCRQEAEERFGVKTMAGNYLNLFRQIINQKR